MQNTDTPVSPQDKEKLTPYLYGLMALLCIATFCEGYDFFVVSLILGDLKETFNVGESAVQYTVAVINIGAILGFFVVRLGDRIGRKPILLIGVAGYAGLAVATALAPGLYAYMILQFLAKIFLATEFGIAIVIVTEEFPSRIRGTCVAILEVTGALGGVGAAVVSKFVLESDFGWRGMYWLGSAPLLMVPVMFFYVKETKHFERIRHTAAKAKKSLFHIWTTPYWKNVVLVGSLWFLGYLAYAGVVYEWPHFAEQERGFSTQSIGPKMAPALVIGMAGYIVSGIMMDKLGRRITGIVFFLGSAVTLVWAYTAHPPYMIPALVAVMFFLFAILPINSTYNAELFPTEMRSDASAWCNYLMGRPAQAIAPAIVGSVVGVVGGLGNAVCLLAIGPLLAAFIVLKYLPETKGIALDKVH